MADDGIATMTDGLGDGREASSRRDLITSDKLAPFDLQQLSLALYMQSLEGSTARTSQKISYLLRTSRAERCLHLNA